MATEREREVLELLAALNEWEQNYGTTYGPNAGLASSGESNARIANLKEQIIAIGGVFHWEQDRYVVDRVDTLGEGSQGLDILGSDQT